MNNFAVSMKAETSNTRQSLDDYSRKSRTLRNFSHRLGTRAAKKDRGWTSLRWIAALSFEIKTKSLNCS